MPVDSLKNYHEMATRIGVAKYRGGTGCPAYIQIVHITKDLDDFVHGNTVVRAMLNISFGIIV